MSKRKPASELNDQNWDVEEEPEEAGTFRLAGQDVLKNRQIRKAKRTMQPGSSNSGSVFAGFALKTDSSVPKPPLSTGVTLNFGSNLTFQPKSNGTTPLSSGGSSKDSSDNPEYLRQLKVLNENILSWIQKHVEQNPYCILTPSFKDYEKHLSGLEKKYSIEGSANNSQDKSDSVDPPVASETKTEAPSIFSAESKPLVSGFSFGQSSTKTEASSKSTSSPDKSDKTATSLTSTSGFTFGSGLTQNTTSGFGAFTQSKGFTFGASTTPFPIASAAKSATDSSAAPAQQSDGKADGDEEYEPPKVEVREIKEDGAVYTKRCKLFYQKDGQWTERGVGNLHLKPTEDGRTQLIVRADTNLGNILLNILLSSAIPTKRQGKNNVFLVCVPNPPINPKEPSSDPVPMLIRVKTTEDADELLAKMDELKTSA